MRRIIGILFVLMLAASVGATGGYGGLYVNNRVPGMGLLRAAQNSNTLYIHPGMTSAQIQAAIDAFEASKTWAADEPGTVIFYPGKYSSLDLSLGSDHIIIDASMPGVVLAGTITAVDSPTGLSIYLWDHPSGTYPASLSLVNIEEV